MDNEAFTRAILDMSDVLYRVAATQLRQRADQEDAVQESLRRAWEKRNKLREDRYVRTWVIRILLNEWNVICQGQFYLLLICDIEPPRHLLTCKWRGSFYSSI